MHCQLVLFNPFANLAQKLVDLSHQITIQILPAMWCGPACGLFNLAHEASTLLQVKQKVSPSTPILGE